MALTQIIATGALDTYLHENATVSHWKMRYARHTNFSCESCVQPFSTPVAFGSESQVTLNRQGDLVHYIYIVVELPGIVACDTTRDSCAGVSGTQFPVFMDRSCAPCRSTDDEYFREMDNDDAASDSSSAKGESAKRGKNMWLKSKLYGHAPALDCCDDAEDCPDSLCPELGNVWCHWVNGIGQYLLKNVKIIIGGSTVDQLWNDFLFIWEELSGKAGRRLTEMIGKRYTRTQLVCDSREKRQLFIPLPFWFCEHSGNALSLASLQFHGVSMHVEWAQLQHCIVVSSSNVQVKHAQNACCLQPSDLKANLETTYVYLENSERDRFANNMFEVLVRQHQSFYTTATTSQPRIQLNFNHPVLECIIALRRQCHERCNNWFCYSGIDNRDPLVSADLLLNNMSRFGKKSATYLRCVVPYQVHTNVPDAFIYVMSFSLHPESVSPSGSCNFSRIDHCDLMLELQEGLSREQTTIIIFALSYNVLRFREGLGGLAFAS